MANLADVVVADGIQTGPFGSQLHAHEYTVLGIPVVMPQDLAENVITTENVARVPVEVAERLDRHRLMTGDIVFSRRGDVTRRALVRHENEGWLCGTGCLRVRPDPHRVDSRFLSYALGTPEARTWLINNAVGATMPNLNTTILRRLPVLLPGLATQTAIAEVLGSLDDKITANERVAGAAHALASAIYTRAVTILPKVPVTVLAEPILGGTPNRKESTYWGAGVPWISVADITGSVLGTVLETEESITPLAAAATRARPVNAGSTIISARGTVGEVGRILEPMAFNQSCYAFEPSQIPSVVLNLTLREAMEEARKRAHGSVFQTITMTTFEQLLVPDVRGQAVALEVELSELVGRADAALKENLALREARDALLPLLMSGRLGVK